MLNEELNLNPIADLDGIKIALVVSKDDPKAQERLLVRVIGVHNMANEDINNSLWANHCNPYASGGGDLPEPGRYVYVMFMNRYDFMHLIWLGCVNSSFQEDVPVSATSPDIAVNTTSTTSVIIT